ncbi:MAG: YceD family protein [Gammaproteobacteria bacterium]
MRNDSIIFAELLRSRYHFTVMPDRITQYLDPFIIAERRRTYRGMSPLNRFERLRDSLIDPRGDVRYELCFAKEDKVYTVTGQIRAELGLECSACLEKMILSVQAEPKLGIVSSLEEAARLSESYEPLLVTDRKVRILEIIEEELLLAIPIIPRHQQCRTINRIDTRPIPKTNTPFSILADLKSTGDP